MWCYRKSVSFTLSKDASLSRPAKVKGSFFPQEYNLVRFFANISNPDETWTTNTTACEWFAVQCNTNQRVESFRLGSEDPLDWHHADKYVGTFTWIHMPDTIQSFRTNKQIRITGTLPIVELAASLKYFVVASCSLFGSVDLTVLPFNLVFLNIRANQFNGALDLTSLPVQFRYLDLGNNLFSGPVDFSRLPAKMKCLRLTGNNIYLPSKISPQLANVLLL